MSCSPTPDQHTVHSDRDPFLPELGQPLLTPDYFSAREWIMQRECDKEVDSVESDSDITQAIPSHASSAGASQSSITSLTLEPPPKLNRTARKNQKSQQKRNKQRVADQEHNQTSLKKRSYKHIREAVDNVFRLPTSLQRDYNPTKPAWIGARDPPDWNVYDLDPLVNPQGQWKMRVIDWDGKICRLIVDADNRVVGVLGGMPKNPNWNLVQLDAAGAIDTARGQLKFEKKELHHRRGNFPALGVGISHGGGQQSPGVLYQNGNTELLNHLMQIESLKQISGFANCLFESYAPRLNKAYHATLDALQGWSDNIVRNYPRTAWAASSINFGPRTVSYPHIDFGNLSWGWCAITALGEFDADKGGHLVLWDLKYVIRFPPGSTIIIPSAMIRHSNTPIGVNEKRYSFAQYSAGGLFRWVDNGFKKDAEWVATANDLDKFQREEERKGRWLRGLDMLSTVDELRNM